MKAKRMRKGLKGSPMRHGGSGRMRIDGLPVRDAKEPLLLEVNKGDVLHSNRKDPGGCAAAVAAMRQEHTSKAYVYRTKTYIKRTDFFERYQNPDGLRIELGAFDKGGEFEPMEFKLNAVPPSSRPKAQHSAYDARKAASVELKVPSKTRALGKAPTHKDSGNRHTGKHPRRYAATQVRPRPRGFNK